MLDQTTYQDALTAATAILPKDQAQDAMDLVHDAICRMLRRVRTGWVPQSPVHELRYLRLCMKGIVKDQRERSVHALSIDA